MPGTQTGQFETELQALAVKISDLDPAAEAKHLANLLAAELDEFLAGYSDFRIEGAGGSGVVLSAVYDRFGTRRAIKVPRKRLYEGQATGESVEVDPELEALSKVSHRHITRLYDSQELTRGTGFCVITEYVPTPTPLDQFAQQLCCSKDYHRHPSLRAHAFKSFAGIVAQVVDALEYLHNEARLLHFDLKPDNILCAPNGTAYVTDLGFARDLDKYSSDEYVEVGFTWKYAHRLLTDPDHGARVSRNPAKSRNTLRGRDLTPVIDIFAFGRTLQECLKKIEDEWKESAHSDYTFNYLHVLACLCLDGGNSVDANGARRDFVSDQALGLPLAFFKAHRVSWFPQITIALDRLLGRRRLEDELPEADPWSSGTINVSDMGITALTPRLQSMLDHPVFGRLADELQLGMLDTVFPTATHTRLQHTLGVFHALCEYVQALYYDPENPSFRVVFDEPTVRAALVASLVHDLGQTTFGHELEEIDETEFSHEEMGALILTDDKTTDSRHRALQQLVDGTEPDEWGVGLGIIVRLLQARTASPFEGVLHDALGGQLDADKLDYLIRDSVEARVRYGHGIDYHRFLRSLTTCAGSEEPGKALRLAVKRKGGASAEAFAFARYELYQSLYWHHTFRSIKAMFATAACESFQALRLRGTPDMLDPHPIRSAYLKHVVGCRFDHEIPAVQIEGGRARGTKPVKLRTVIEECLRTADGPEKGGKYAEDPTISFLFRLSGGRAKQLLQDLADRRYYKRVVEIPLSDFREEGWVNLREVFRNAKKRLALQAQVEEVLTNALRSALQDQCLTGPR